MMFCSKNSLRFITVLGFGLLPLIAHAQVPAMPASVTATADNKAGVVTIEWDDNATNETSQQIWVATDGGALSQLATLPANQVKYQHLARPLSASKSFKYAIRAVNGTAVSDFAYSDPVEVDPVTPPAAATNVVASVDARGGVTIQWQENATNAAAQEIMVTSDGVNYSSLARVSPGTNFYTYAPTVSSASRFAYLIRSSNFAGTTSSVRSVGVSVAPVNPWAKSFPTAAYSIDTTTRQAWIRLDKGDSVNTSSINSVLNALKTRTDKQNMWIVYMSGGLVNVGTTFNFDNLQNVTFLSNPASRATFAKASLTSTNEWLIRCAFCKNVTINGFEFRGTSAFSTATKTAVWGDQGVFMPSTRGCRLTNNNFKNIGNAAIRMVTFYRDTVTGINSFDNIVENNTFTDIYQTTTTADETLTQGGSQNYIFRGNTITGVYGSVKFATRTDPIDLERDFPGPSLTIENNKIDNAPRIAFEMAGYNNMRFAGNSVHNTPHAISVQTNYLAPYLKYWGGNNNIVFTGNTFDDVALVYFFLNQAFTKYGVIDSSRQVSTQPYPTSPNPYIYFVANGAMFDNNKVTNLHSKTDIDSGKAIVPFFLDLHRVNITSMKNNSVTSPGTVGISVHGTDNYAVTFAPGAASGNTLNGAAIDVTR